MTKSLEYNSSTGDFTWITGRRRGQIAGTKTYGGYIRISISGKAYYAHRAYISRKEELHTTFKERV